MFGSGQEPPFTPADSPIVRGGSDVVGSVATAAVVAEATVRHRRPGRPTGRSGTTRPQRANSNPGRLSPVCRAPATCRTTRIFRHRCCARPATSLDSSMSTRSHRRIRGGSGARTEHQPGGRKLWQTARLDHRRAGRGHRRPSPEAEWRRAGCHHTIRHTPQTNRCRQGAKGRGARDRCDQMVADIEELAKDPLAKRRPTTTATHRPRARRTRLKWCAGRPHGGRKSWRTLCAAAVIILAAVVTAALRHALREGFTTGSVFLVGQVALRWFAGPSIISPPGHPRQQQKSPFAEAGGAKRSTGVSKRGLLKGSWL